MLIICKKQSIQIRFSTPEESSWKCCELTCLDYMAGGLASYVRSGETSPDYYNENGKLRLNLEPASLAELLEAAFDLLRHAS